MPPRSLRPWLAPAAALLLGGPALTWAIACAASLWGRPAPLGASHHEFKGLVTEERWFGSYRSSAVAADAIAWCSDRPVRRPVGPADRGPPLPPWIAAALRHADPREAMVLVVAGGWPWLSFTSARYPVASTAAWSPASGLHPAGPTRILPILPVWPAFLASSALYGGLLSFTILATRAARRTLRRRRNLCPACAYRRDGLAPAAPCPECGLAPPARPAPAPAPLP